jgi:hypothetical protein
VSIVETAKSVEGLKNELPHLSERTKGTEEITRQTKGVALSSKKAAYTPSVPSKNETMPSVVVPSAKAPLRRDKNKAAIQTPKGEGKDKVQRRKAKGVHDYLANHTSEVKEGRHSRATKQTKGRTRTLNLKVPSVPISCLTTSKTDAKKGAGTKLS